MSLCLNPECPNPQNNSTEEICQSCGSKLLLRERYRAVRILGQGGFGKTFLAIDQDRLRAHCVIKQFLPQVQGTGALEKATVLFNQEAVRLYELGEHPQIPSLLAYFTQEKRQYLVQDFIPGVNLLQCLQKNGKFSESQIWLILTDLLPVLQFVHEQQVIHRDIKPENIIRREGDDRLILIDFGVAKLLTANSRTVTGTSIGTSGYVPLEQMEDGKVYPASDIYSLGVTCFHLLTGVTPYSLFLKRGYSWLQDWERYLPGKVSTGLITILKGMMQEDRYKRYPTAAAALEEIRKYYGSSGPESVAPLEDEEEESIAKLLQERTTLPTLKRESPPDSPSNDGQDEAFITNFVKDINKGESGEPEDEAFISEFLQDISKGEPKKQEEPEDEAFISEFLQNIGKKSEASFPAHLPYPPVARRTPPNQDFNEDVTSAQTWRCLRTIRVHDQGVSYVAIKPNGQTVITAGLRRIVKSWDIDSGDAIGTIIDADTCSSCSGLGKVPKDATVLFVKTRQMITCPDCAGFGTNSQNGERFWTSRMSTNGAVLAIASLDQVIKVWDLSLGRFSRALDKTTSVVQILALNADGTVLAYVTQDNHITVYHLERQIEINHLRGHTSPITCLDISGEGSLVVSGSENGIIKLWSVVANTPPQEVQGHKQGVSAIALSSDRMIVVSGSREGTVKVWNLATGHLVHSLKRHPSAISAITINSDNITLATGSNDGLLCIWHLPRGELITTLEGHTDRITSITVSPSGQTFITSSLDGTIRVWRAY